jgi:hypothetical protein
MPLALRSTESFWPWRLRCAWQAGRRLVQPARAGGACGERCNLPVGRAVRKVGGIHANRGSLRWPDRRRFCRRARRPRLRRTAQRSNASRTAEVGAGGRGVRPPGGGRPAVCRGGTGLLALRARRAGPQRGAGRRFPPRLGGDAAGALRGMDRAPRKTRQRGHLPPLPGQPADDGRRLHPERRRGGVGRPWPPGARARTCAAGAPWPATRWAGSSPPT